MAEEGGGGFFGPGKKQMSKETFKAYLFWAIAIDVIFGWWLPGAGTVFVGVCYGTWWLHGYNIDKLGTKAGISAVCGFVPFLELVSNIVFVCVAYADNVKNTAASALATGGTTPDSDKKPGADNQEKSPDAGGAQKAANDNEKPAGGKQSEAKNTGGGGTSGGALKDAPTQKTDNLARKNKDEATGTSVQGRDTSNHKADNLLRNNTDEAIGTPVRGQETPEAKHVYEPRQPVFRAQPLYDSGEGGNDTPAPSDNSDDTDLDEPDEATNSPQPEEEEDGGDFDTFDNVKRVA